MSTPETNRKQLGIDFEYDDRVVQLAGEFGLMMAPHLAPGTTTVAAQNLAARMALLAAKRMDKFAEPPELMICHTCDAKVGPKDRARVVVCFKCGFGGGSPGSDG